MLWCVFMGYQRIVRLGDTDAAGVIYFTSLLSICHEAYEFRLQDLGLNLKDFLTNSLFVVPIIHAEIDFFKPLFWGDTVEVFLQPTLASESRFILDYSVSLVSQEQQLVAKAKTIHLCIDTITRERRFLPEYFLDFIGLGQNHVTDITKNTLIK